MFSSAAVDRKRIILMGLCLMCIVGPASAYQLYLSCPESVQAGLPLHCSVDSNLPAGTMVDVVFYRSVYVETPFSHVPGTIQGDRATLYQTFETKGLPGGQYKVEVRFSGPEAGKLSSDSVILQVPRLIDRSGDITITSPLSQAFDEALRIEGAMSGLGNRGIDIGVRGPDGFMFGPRFISTKVDFRTGAGVFTRKVAVTTPGTYEVSFTDEDGYIGARTFTVLARTGQVVPAPVPAATPAATHLPTTVSPVSTTTPQSPLSFFSSLGALSIIGLFAIGIGKLI